MKRDPTPEWTLCIEPHSSISHTIALPKEPTFTHFIHEAAKFHLASGGTLSYCWVYADTDTPQPAKIDFHIEPIALNTGDLTLTITNQSSNPLSAIQNIAISTTAPNTVPNKDLPWKNITYPSTPLPDSVMLDLQPNESKTVRIPHIPLHSEKSYPPLALSPIVEIDNIRYQYSAGSDSFYLYQRTVYYDPNLSTSPRRDIDIRVTGNMEIADEAVLYYLTFHNTTQNTQIVPTLNISSQFENSFYTKKGICWARSLENDPSLLYPNESKHYFLCLPLLTDNVQQTLESATIFTEEEVWQNSIFFACPTISPQPLHPIQKILYQPLCFSVIDFSFIYPSFLSID